MMRTNHFSSGVVLGMISIMLLGCSAAQGEESKVSSAAAETNLPPVAPTNAAPAPALPEETDTNSAYGELVRLVQAGVDQGVISAYIENSLRLFNLDADRIIYLTDLGAPSEIIEAAMAHDSQLLQEGISPDTEQLPEITEPMTNQPPEVTEDDLYDTLSPYGTWTYIEGYGRCWRPTVVIYNSSWRPYCDNGRWVYTDCGWYWISDYSWGWAAFHYGRWFRHARYGWCWWPDTVWSPSWVCWRYDRDYCGWAPLPPYTSFRYGTGIVYRGSRVSVGFNFGLDSSCYTFVATRNLCDPKPRLHCVDRRDAQRIYDRTKVFNRMDYDASRQRMVNEGISPNIVSALSSQSIEPVSVQYAGKRSGTNSRHEQLSRDTKALVVSRPDHAASSRREYAGQTSSGVRQIERSQERRTYAPTDRGSNFNAERMTQHRSTTDRMQHAQSSVPRQPKPAPQARQQRSPTPPVNVNVPPPMTQRPSPSQNYNNGQSDQSSSRSAGNASVRGQERSSASRPNVTQSGKSTHAGRARSAGHGRPNAANDNQ